MSDTGRTESLAETKSSGPSVLFLWVWNWFAALPKTVANLFADLKSGELRSRFTMLDAMCQFIVAVATSCHPQEELMPDEDIKEYSPKKKSDCNVFQGTARTLRSRTVDGNWKVTQSGLVNCWVFHSSYQSLYPKDSLKKNVFYHTQWTVVLFQERLSFWISRSRPMKSKMCFALHFAT